MRILALIFTLLFSINSYSNDIYLKDYKSIEIQENDEFLIMNFKTFIPINKNLFVIFDNGNGKALFYDSNGVFIKGISPPIEFIDSIANNMLCASIYLDKSIRFLFLNEITFPSDSPNAGKIVPMHILDENIKKGYENGIVINDSLIALICSYDMIVKNMDPNAKRYLRGKENSEIVIFFNYQQYTIHSLLYLNYKNKIFPRTYQLSYNKKDDIFYCAAVKDSDVNSNDTLPMIIGYNKNHELKVFYNLPKELKELNDEIGLLGPFFKYNNNNGEMYCAFRTVEKVYNFDSKLNFSLLNIGSNNNEFLKNIDLTNPNFDEQNFRIQYMGFLSNGNLIFVINRLKYTVKKYLIQEYSLSGNLIKERAYDDNNIFKGFEYIKTIDYQDYLYWVSYDEESESYFLKKFKWE